MEYDFLVLEVGWTGCKFVRGTRSTCTFGHIVAIFLFLTRAKPYGTELVCQSKSLLDPCLPLTSWSGKNGEIAC